MVGLPLPCEVAAVGRSLPKRDGACASLRDQANIANAVAFLDKLVDTVPYTTYFWSQKPPAGFRVSDIHPCQPQQSAMAG